MGELAKRGHELEMKKDANKRGELILADVKKKTAGGGGERYNLNSKDKKEQA